MSITHDDIARNCTTSGRQVRAVVAARLVKPVVRRPRSRPVRRSGFCLRGTR